MRASPHSAIGHYPGLDTSLDERDCPVLAVSGVEYRTIADLVRDYPEVESGERLALLCEVWLRLNHGSGYRLIHDPAEFRTRYHALRQRGYGGVRARHSTPAAGCYDVSEIDEPRLYQDTLRCYVEDRMNGVPYRVEMPWPLQADALTRFMLLPMEDDDDMI